MVMINIANVQVNLKLKSEMKTGMLHSEISQGQNCQKVMLTRESRRQFVAITDDSDGAH